MTHLIGYSVYLPRYRIQRNRVVASYDEDSTTMAVAAANEAVRRAAAASATAVYFATSSPAYADKTNATAIHAALGLRSDTFATDMCGTGRSAFAAIRAAVASGGLAVAADVRTGRPGSTDEKVGGDAAVALLFGEAPDPIAHVLGTASVTEEFLDRWRCPTSLIGEQWEERYGAARYSSLIRDTTAQALNAAGLAEVDHVGLACPNTAVLRRAAGLVKARKSVRTSPVGFSGTADAAVALGALLDVAEPGDTILLLSATDGCDALVLQAAAALTSARQPIAVDAQRAGGRPVPQLTYLSWRGLIELEPPRRPAPDRPAAPPAGRSGDWKFGLTGAQCVWCGFIHLPAVAVCRSCGRRDVTKPVRVADLGGTVASFTVDHLAYTPCPPMVQAAVDVDGGGRLTMEIADADPKALAVGARVRFVFRRLFTAGNVHDYFWKAALVDGQ